MSRFATPLFRPLDGASLGLLRALFGMVMVIETIRYIMYARVVAYYVMPTYFFKYWGFGWVQNWPGESIYLLFALMGAGAAGLMAGFCTRLSSFLFLIAYSYIYCIDASLYNNHYYLIILLAFLFFITPCEAAWSLDARRKKRLALRAGQPPPPETVPAWSIYIFQFQLACVYTYAAIAKWTPDWIIHGEPMRTWLYFQDDKIPYLAPLFKTEAAGWFFVYSGMLFDLIFVPLLLWRRTRWLAVILALLFHGTNKLLFNIGIFPMMAFATTVIFFDPDWPRQIINKMNQRFGRKSTDKITPIEKPANYPGPLKRSFILTGLGVYALIQILLPLRHHLYPGNPSWTEEGHRYSWRMKLRDKYAELHYVKVADPATRRMEEVNIRDYLLPHQEEALQHPHMAVQFARLVEQEYRDKRGWKDPQVFIKVMVSLNGRPLQPLVDPWTDLTEVSLFPWPPADWIVPLDPVPPVYLGGFEKETPKALPSSSSPQ